MPPLAPPTVSPPALREPRVTTVPLSELLTALSHALDLTEGQPMGHTVRSCIIGMRMADELALPSAERSALYYALLLKDAGCSSNAARMTALFGSDDHEIKPRMKSVDWHAPVRLAAETFRCVAQGRTLRERVRRFVAIARTGNVTRDLIQIRCDRGADIALRLGFPVATADAIRALDEHWNGLGYPAGLRGEEIPLLARMVNLAQTLEAFAAARGPAAALEVARARSGSWFDPRLVRMACGWAEDRAWWATLQSPDTIAAAAALEPAEDRRQVDEAGLDEVARAFAEIIDAKSPFTFRHSENVASIARAVGAQLGFGDDARTQLWRAGLLHDIGKLGVSNRILDKQGALDDAERTAIKVHPRFTREILSRVGAFAGFAEVASHHHEKLDGSGYPWGLRGDALEQAARILAVADMYEALTADRPYRDGMPHAAAFEILARDRGVALCPDAMDALEASVRPAAASAA